MRPLEKIHEGYVASRRVRVLCEQLLPLIPPSSVLLDVGGGDWRLAAELMRERPDLVVSGLEVTVRPGAAFPVDVYEGKSFPMPDRSFDVVLLVDVLHHTDDPAVLLREASRVARISILIKDHLADRFLARPTLRFMDRIGNSRFGISLPYNYWPKGKWLETFRALGLRVVAWKSDLKIYPPRLEFFFGKSLHFVAALSPGSLTAEDRV